MDSPESLPGARDFMDHPTANPVPSRVARPNRKHRAAADDASVREVTRVSAPPPHPVFWLIGVSLMVIAAVMVLRLDADLGAPGNAAFGQAVSSSGLRGVYSFSAQLNKETFGVYMVDVDAMTIWLYKYDSRKGCLKLEAARTWRYDRYLKDYNTCDPSPYDIEQLIEREREAEMQRREDMLKNETGP